jgi:hypothetical protein
LKDGYMYKFHAMILVVAGATLYSVGASQADSLRPNTGPALERSLRDFNGSFELEYVQNRLTLNDRSDGPLGIPDRTPAEIQGIRDTIAGNRHLLGSLRGHGVSPRNIVNAYRAADGSMIFYVR